MSAQTIREVAIGTWVKVRGLVPGEETALHFVRESEVDYYRHRLPVNGLLGQALIGAKAGDTVWLDVREDLALDHPVELTILEVRRE